MYLKGEEVKEHGEYVLRATTHTNQSNGLARFLWLIQMTLEILVLLWEV